MATKLIPTGANETTLSVTLKASNDALALPRMVAKLNTEHLEQAHDKLKRAIVEYKSNLRQLVKLVANEEAVPQELSERNKELAHLVDTLPYFPTLRTLRKVDEDGAAKDVMLLMLWATKQVTVTANASTEQIKSLAVEVLNNPEWSILRLEDLAIIFREGLKGKYGQIYNRMDGAILRGWIDTYATELREARMRKQNDQYLSLKEGRSEQRTAERDRTGLHEARLKNHIETLKREQE